MLATDGVWSLLRHVLPTTSELGIPGLSLVQSVQGCLQPASLGRP